MTSSVFKYSTLVTDDGLTLRCGRVDALHQDSSCLVLLLGGRAEFMEKYDRVARELNRRNFPVLSFDWRGQGLSGRENTNRHKGYVRSFDDYLEDLELFYQRVVLPMKRRVIVLAHSMGAHLALRFMHDHPGAIASAVLVSTMIDIRTSPFPRRIVPLLSSVASMIGLSRSYVPGGKDFQPGVCPPIARNRLTHDPARHTMVDKAIHENPGLALGDVTWGWLTAAFDSMDRLVNRDYAAEIVTPILMVAAEEDTVVCVTAQKRMCMALPRCTFVSIPGAWHEILHETHHIRELFWEYFDAFTGTGAV